MIQQVKEFLVPEELKVRIQKYASDRIGVHPAAQLIQPLRRFSTCEQSELKVVLSYYKHGEYFILLRDGRVGWDYVRSYTSSDFSKDEYTM